MALQIHLYFRNGRIQTNRFSIVIRLSYVIVNWKLIWIHTLERNCINAFNVASLFHIILLKISRICCVRNDPTLYISKHTVERNPIYAFNVASLFHIILIEIYVLSSSVILWSFYSFTQEILYIYFFLTKRFSFLFHLFWWQDNQHLVEWPYTRVYQTKYSICFLRNSYFSFYLHFTQEIIFYLLFSLPRNQLLPKEWDSSYGICMI